MGKHGLPDGLPAPDGASVSHVGAHAPMFSRADAPPWLERGPCRGRSFRYTYVQATGKGLECLYHVVTSLSPH